MRSRKVIIITVLFAVLIGSPIDSEAQTAETGQELTDEQVAGDLLRGDLLDLLDHAEFIVGEMGMSDKLLAELQSARDQLILAPEHEFEVLAPHMGELIQALKQSTEHRSYRLLSREEKPGRSRFGKASHTLQGNSLMSLVSGSPFPGREHFNIDWSFESDAATGEPGGDASEENVEGRCQTPGPSENDLLDAKRDEIIAYSVKVTAERFCQLTILGFNVNVACIITDVIYFVFKAMSESEQLCGDIVGRSELNAIYDGMEFVHGQLQTANSGIDSAIDALTNSTLNNIASTRDTITSNLSNTQESIENSIESATTSVIQTINASETNLDLRISLLESGVLDATAGVEQDLTILINARSDAIDQSLEDTADFIAEFHSENRRLQIEANLAEQGRPVAPFKPLASLQTADFMEEVRTIVRETIDRMIAAGESVNSAESQYQTGVQHLSAMEYGEAYKWFGQAYQSAAR